VGAGGVEVTVCGRGMAPEGGWAEATSLALERFRRPSRFPASKSLGRGTKDRQGIPGRPAFRQVTPEQFGKAWLDGGTSRNGRLRAGAQGRLVGERKGGQWKKWTGTVAEGKGNWPGAGRFSLAA